VWRFFNIWGTFTDIWGGVEPVFWDVQNLGRGLLAGDP
jgi:hypothetical protein